MSISPLGTRLVVPPGGHGLQVVTVSNGSDEPLDGRVLLRDWTLSGGDQGGVRYHEPGTQVRSCTLRVQVVPEVYALPPGASQDLTVSVSLPEDAEGSCFAALLVAFSSPRAVEVDPGVLMRPRLQFGHLVVVDTEGRTSWAADLLDLAVSTPDDTRPLTISGRLANRGNGSIRAEGSFIIVDEQGALVSKVAMRPSGAQPGGTARVLAEFHDLLAPGRYRVIGVIDIGGGKVLAPEAEFEVVDRLELSGVELATEDDVATAVLHLENAGHITHVVSGVVEVQHKGAAIRTAEVEAVTLLPHTRREVRVPLGVLPAVSDVLEVRLESTTASLHCVERFENGVGGATVAPPGAGGDNAPSQTQEKGGNPS
ncbi:MAG: hypothetical protein JRI25_16200 [Deltaproteobacteria bacterium]|nr:hypothetical protein [Deltaproteobacteria bacterium]MBW2256122.1 hypothetical protein [Deltaproteobacteria bacterium]